MRTTKQLHEFCQALDYDQAYCHIVSEQLLEAVYTVDGLPILFLLESGDQWNAYGPMLEDRQEAIETIRQHLNSW